MSQQIEIEFADGERVTCASAGEKTLLQSAAAAGLRLAYDCKQGQCQACKMQLVDGDVRYAHREKITLSEVQEEEGCVLPCQALAQTDVRLLAPYTRASLLPVKQKTVEVEDVFEAGPGAIEVRCRFGAHSRFEHLPGQYVRLALSATGDGRSYSMTTCTADWPSMRFLVRKIPGGAFSSKLAQLQPGDKLSVRGPHGSFYLRDGDGPMLWVAGGTGLAPFLSMLSALQHAGRTDSEIVLCFGVNDLHDMCWPANLRALLEAFPKLEMKMAMRQPSEDWNGVCGSAVDAMAEFDLTALAARGCQAYLCGPPAMVEAARGHLVASGFASVRIHNEEFLPSVSTGG